MDESAKPTAEMIELARELSIPLQEMTDAQFRKHLLMVVGMYLQMTVELQRREPDMPIFEVLAQGIQAGQRFVDNPNALKKKGPVQ